MQFGWFNGRILGGAALGGLMLAVTGCQSSDGGILGVGGKTEPKPDDVKLRTSQLNAYCPTLTLRDGTAYFNTYAKGGQDDASKIIYQASISDLTRDCTRANGTLTMDVAVAGKVVPGPLGTAGSITMPIRIVVMRGTDVLYSQLHQYKVQVSDTSAATQFVFKDAGVSVPEPTARNYQVFAGFDEVQAKPKPKAEEAAPVRRKVVRRKPKPPVAAAPAAPAQGSQTSISDIPR